MGITALEHGHVWMATATNMTFLIMKFSSQVFEPISYWLKTRVLDTKIQTKELKLHQKLFQLSHLSIPPTASYYTTQVWLTYVHNENPFENYDALITKFRLF